MNYHSHIFTTRDFIPTVSAVQSLDGWKNAYLVTIVFQATYSMNLKRLILHYNVLSREKLKYYS